MPVAAAQKAQPMAIHPTRLRAPRHTVLPAFCASAAFLLLAALPAAASSSDSAPAYRFTFRAMFTFFFLMLGPLKVIGPFVQLTRSAAPSFTRRLAFRAFLFSCLALLATVLIGESAMKRFHVSVEVLAITAGIILFLVALKTVLQQFDSSPAAPPDPSAPASEPTLQLALSPLTFPVIVTPYGVAAVIICVALTPDVLAKGAISAALFGLMLLNLVAMLYARVILKYAAMPLQLIGTVLGVIQVALGLQIIVAGIRNLDILSKP